MARQLAREYRGDPASADWRHVGRLAGFTNQKPARCTVFGYAPWVKILHARAILAPNANALLESAKNFGFGARQNCPDFDPDVPYHRPIFDSLEADPKYERERLDLIKDLDSEPEPAPEQQAPEELGHLRQQQADPENMNLSAIRHY